METLIFQFKLPAIQSFRVVEHIVSMGYQMTGNKFRVEFNGSKGYLSNIEISCEGRQTERNNVIWVENHRTKRGLLRRKMVHIYHSEENGIRIDI